MTDAPILRVDISRVPSTHHRRALIALDFLGIAIGVRISVVADREADLRYGGDREEGASACLPYWSETYDPAAAHVEVVVDGLSCWVPMTRREAWPADLIGSTWRLLALLDETQVPAASRDPGGAFLTDALPPARRAQLDQPLAEWHAAALMRHLEASGVRLDGLVDRWPGGRPYAALVTHDVDGPRLQQTGELAKALAKGVVRRSAGEARAFAAGLSSRLLRRQDPYFAFAGWAGAERSLGLRSAFYLYVRTRVRRHPRDPLYVIDRHSRWDVLRALADEGWEVGVHAGIHSAEADDGLRQEREQLTTMIGRPVVGLRHHYWRLDWWSPSATFERQLAAGFEYDSSMAWRDRPGFRAGTSLPYFPPSVEGDRPLALVEIPTSLMDGHLFEYLRLEQAAAADASDVLRRRIASAGGVLTIDWHERTFCDRYSYRGWATVALGLLSSLSTDAWVATPVELARWWRARAASVGLPEIRPG